MNNEASGIIFDEGYMTNGTYSALNLAAEICLGRP